MEGVGESTERIVVPTDEEIYQEIVQLKSGLSKKEILKMLREEFKVVFRPSSFEGIKRKK